MKTATINVGSVTYAVKLKRYLETLGVNSKIKKSDIEKSNNGCRYGIALPSERLYDAILFLRANNIEYSVKNSNDIP